MSVTHKHFNVVKNFDREHHEKMQKRSKSALFGSTAVRRNVEGRASLKWGVNWVGGRDDMVVGLNEGFSP